VDGVLNLLKRFADADLDVEEFRACYWPLRLRWHLDRGELEGALATTLLPFDRTLLTYTPDLEPEVRHTEDRELRRRAAAIRRVLIGQPPGLRHRTRRTPVRRRAAG
jgi:hypothetical protein